jgi:hypothetical protein
MQCRKKTSLYDLNIKLQKIVQCRRFTLKPKRYYCTFYRSDIDPPEKGIAQSQVSKNRKENRK